MTKTEYDKVINGIATEYLSKLLGSKFTLQNVNENGIIITCDADVSDEEATYALYSLSTRWGYQYGSCEIRRQLAEDEFFSAVKTFTLKFR